MATPLPTSSTSPSPWARCEEQGGRPWLGRREGFSFRRNHSSFRPPGVCRYAYVGIVGYEKRSFRSRLHCPFRSTEHRVLSFHQEYGDRRFDRWPEKHSRREAKYSSFKLSTSI